MNTQELFNKIKIAEDNCGTCYIMIREKKYKIVITRGIMLHNTNQIELRFFPEENELYSVPPSQKNKEINKIDLLDLE